MLPLAAKDPACRLCSLQSIVGEVGTDLPLPQSGLHLPCELDWEHANSYEHCDGHTYQDHAVRKARCHIRLRPSQPDKVWLTTAQDLLLGPQRLQLCSTQEPG